MQNYSYPDVNTYYRDTRFDYRLVWNRADHLSVHFGYYDEAAKWHHDALVNMNRVLADLAGIQAGDLVLDAGCGMGGTCFWLAEHRQALPTGISIVESQLEDCRRAAARRPHLKVAFLWADFCATPFPDGHFDVVWACESQCHASRKADFYREAWRVLKPGGRLVVADFFRRQRPNPPEGERLLLDWLLPWAIPDIDTADEHRAHATAAGFSEVSLRDVTPHVRVSLRNLHRLCRRWLPIGKVFRRVGIVNDVRLNNVRASIKMYEALEVDAWWYGMLRAVK